MRYLSKSEYAEAQRKFSPAHQADRIAKRIIKAMGLGDKFFNWNDRVFIHYLLKWNRLGQFDRSKACASLMRGPHIPSVLFHECIQKFKRLGLVTVDEFTLRKNPKRRVGYGITNAFYKIAQIPPSSSRTKSVKRHRLEFLRKLHQKRQGITNVSAHPVLRYGHANY